MNLVEKIDQILNEGSKFKKGDDVIVTKSGYSADTGETYPVAKAWKSGGEWFYLLGKKGNQVDSVPEHALKST